MAFEDRSSPSAAASPGSSGHHTVNSPESSRTTYSPESTRTTQYTCSTLYTPMLKHEPFLRITSYALSSPKREPEEPESSSASERGEDLSTSRSNSPEAPHQQSIQQLKYSIINILQPDFGKSAISRTRVSSKITFKPYENERGPELKVDPPLGGLCRTVSQIGKVQEEAEAEVRSKSPQAPLGRPATEEAGGKKSGELPTLWPAWVYCTRYSDRPSSGPRSRRMKKPPTAKSEEKRPRTAFSGAQLARLKHEFAENRYLTERRRQQLSQELGLNEAQIKIWFQNKRAKIKKSSGQKHPLALQLMAQGLYNHSTVPCDEDDMPLDACGST